VHALSVLKTACHEALEEGDLALFLSVFDPGSMAEGVCCKKIKDKNEGAGPADLLGVITSGLVV
jgi:hypothetical protein